MKRALLVVAIAVSFLAGYVSYAKAQFPVYGRNEYYGYFKNQFDSHGDKVWDEGIPTSVNSATEFINYVKARLNKGPNTQQGIGAAFIIQTMIGSSRDTTPSGAQVDEWERRVRYSASQGWIRWNTSVSYRLNSYYQGNSTGSNPKDDAFYSNALKTDTVIQFRNGSGAVKYELKHSCANPVGTISPLPNEPNVTPTPAPTPTPTPTPAPAKYTLTGTSTVSDGTVVPGQTITFTHSIKNSGPNAAPNVRFTVYDQANAVKATGGPTAQGVTTRTVNTNNLQIPNNAIPGTKFCQHVHFTPKNENGGSGDSTDACATVIGDFELTPTATSSASSAQQGDTLTFTYRVYNAGPTPSSSITCKVVGTTHGPGYNPLPQQDTNRNSDPGYAAPGTSCPTNIFVNSTQTIATESVNIGNVTPGSRVCRSLVVDPKNETGGPRASAEACVVIAKTPYAHMMGGDVWAGGGFPDVNPACNTSAKIASNSHTLSSTNAGSGGEYGVFAMGKITNFGSASKALVNPAAAAGKLLTFGNYNSSNLGYYASPQHCIEDYTGMFSTVGVTGQPDPVNLRAQASGVYHYTGNTRFISGGAPMFNGTKQVYYVEGDVDILDHVKYSDSYNNVDEIPSITIIATGNMSIQWYVNGLDGVYIAKGTINTCVGAPATLSVNDCKVQLPFNGPVIAGKLDLRRTFGADGSSDNSRKQPAEIFNYSPELFLRNGLSSGSSSLQVVDEKDLPPRY